MEPINKKKIQLTHNDLDGIGCAVIAKIVGINYHIICTYNNIDEKLEMLRQAVEEGITTTVYITDLSVTKKQMLWLDDFIEKHKHRVVFCFYDHHQKTVEVKTELMAEGLLKNPDVFMVVEGISATELFANQVVGLCSNIREFTMMVTAWDLQKSEETDGCYYDYFETASQVNMICRALPIFTAISKLHHNLMIDVPVYSLVRNLSIEGNYIVDSENAKTKGLIENVFRYIDSGAYRFSKTLPGYDHLEEALSRFLAIHNPEYDIDEDMSMVMILPSLDYKITQVATAVFDKYQSINVVVEIAFLGDRITFNLRSRKHTVYDVCELAKLLDEKGGGHKHAAGASISHGEN